MFGFTLGQIVVGAAVVMLVVAVLNRKAFSRFWESGRAQVGKGARWAWSRDPVAILQDRIDVATGEIANATAELENYVGQSESINQQVAGNQKLIKELDAKVRLALKNGNEDRAAQYVLSLNREKAALEINQAQAERYKTTYQNNLAKLQAARKRVMEAKDEARHLGTELKTSQMEKELTVLSKKFNISSTNIEGLDEVTSEIRKQINANRAVGKVSADLGDDGMAEIAEKEQADQESAKALLEQYKSEMK